jgi:hypothetical protein
VALIFGDSFDHYLYADILKKWTLLSGTGTIYATFGPTYAMPPHRQGLRWYYGTTAYLTKVLPAAVTTFVFGVYFRLATGLGAYRLVAFYDGATAHSDLRCDAAGHIIITRNGTVLATSANMIVANTWYHIEAKITTGDTTGNPATWGAYEVKIDGTSVGWIPSATDQDTRNGGNASIDRFVFDGSNHDLWLQDVYILDTTGASANGFIGPSRLVVLEPIGAGNSADFSGTFVDNFVNLRDPDGDTAYNESTTPGHIDLFSMADVPAGTVHAIQHVLMARKDAGAARTLRAKTRISGANYNGASISLTSTYAFYTDPVSVSPATSSAFSDTELNALEGGYELVS